MVAIPDYNYLSPEEYLALEAESPVKHEYIDGEVYAIAGATDTHVTIALNLAIALRSHLRGSGCRVYIADLKVRLRHTIKDRFYYPDLVVTCDLRDRETPTYKQFPKAIVEVLSDSTEGFDRGDKFADYRNFDSLQEYVLVSTKQPRIDIFRRSGEHWTFQSYALENETFALPSLDFKGAIASVYEDITFESSSTREAESND
jgi:Uma2 family endonuclease